MAPIIFANAILKNTEIKVNNFGEMSRDFTFIDDVVEGVYRCCLKPATSDKEFNALNPSQESSFAPHRIFNIGGNKPIKLLTFIELMEKTLNKKAKLSLCGLPPGDVIDTAANTDALEKWIGYIPNTPLNDGMILFLDWFKEYY